MPLQAISSDVTTATMETTRSTPSVALASLTIPSGVGISVTGTITGAAHTTGDIFVASFAALVVNVGEGAEIRGMSIAPLHSAGTDADNWMFSVGVEAGQPLVTLDVTGDDKVIDWCASYEMVQVTDEFDVTPDYTPDVIVFVNAVDALTGAAVTSNTVTITGIDDGTSFLIAGGVAVIDGVEVGDNGIINNGQTFALRSTSSTNNAVETVVNWAVGTESGQWNVRTAPVEMPRNSNVHYGIDIDWQGPIESEVDVFARDFASIQDAVTAIKNLADSEGVVRTYTLGLEPDTIYREEVNLYRVRFPNDSTLKLTTINGTPDTMATISGADILSGLVPCNASDQPRVGDQYANILKVNVPSPSFNPNAMNLHEDGERLDLVTDRAQETDLTLFTFDPTDWHTATSKSVDGDNHINGYTSPVIASYSADQLLAAQVLIYGSSNRTTLAPIDSAVGDTINFTSGFVPSTNSLRNNFALLNILPKLSDTDLPTGRWGYFDEGDGTVTIYILPRNQAQPQGRFEYSVREICIDTADLNRLVIEGINAYQTGGSDNQNGICIGTRTDRTKAVVDRRDSLIIRNVRAGKKGLTEGTNYGAFSVSVLNKVIIENCHMHDVPYGPGISIFPSSNVTINNNLIERVETTPISCFGGGTNSDGSLKASGLLENLQILNNHMKQCGREVHANKFNAYQQCNYVIFAGNIYDDCYGYFTWQECSNIVVAWNLIPDGNRNADTSANRAVADQQNRTAEPDPSGFSIFYNNQSTPNPLTLSDGGNWQLFAANGTQTTSVYNNIMTGLSRLAGYPTYFGSAAHNIIAVDGINLDSSDINIPDYSTLYRDAAGEDFSFVDGGVINNMGFDMRPVIQNILDAWANGPIQGDSANIGHPLDRAVLETDRNGNLVNWDQAFIGSYDPLFNPDIIPVSFGANTLAMHGGVPVNGSVIISGDDGGEFTIADGYLMPVSDGFTASGYSLTLDSGDQLDITIETDTYSIRTLDQAAQAAKHAVAPGSDPTKAATIKFRDARYRGDLNIAALPGSGDVTKTGVVTDPDRLYYTADSDGFPLSVVGHENAAASFDGGYLKLASEAPTPQELVGRTRISGIGSLWLENLIFLNETPRDGFAYEPERAVTIDTIVSLGNPTIVSVDETKELTPNVLVNITGASGFDQLNAAEVRILEINGNAVSFDLDTTGLTPSYVAGSASFLGARDNANHETDSLLIDVGTVSPEPARVLIQNCKSGAVDITNNARYPNGFRISRAEKVVIEDCELDGFYNGISIGDCQDVTVRRNSLRRQISDGIRVFTSDGLSGENANVSVTHNTIFDPILDIAHGARHNDGIQMGTHNDTIGYDIFEAYNYVYLPGAQCLYHDDFPSPLKMRGVITNNLCLGSAGNGIRLWRNDDHFVQVLNNTMLRATEFTSDTSADIEPAIINAEAGRALFDNNIVAQINISEGDFVTNTVDIDHFDENGMSAYSTVFTGPFGFDTSLGHTYTIDTTNAATVRQSLDDVFQGNSGFETAGHNAPPRVLMRPAPAPSTPEGAIFNLADIRDTNRIINANSENYFPDNMTEFTVVMRVAADFTLGQEFLSAGSSTRIVGFVAATGLRLTIGGERFQTTAFPDAGQLTTIILSVDLTRPAETDRYRIFFDYNNGERRLVNVTDTGQTIDLTEFHASNWANLSLFASTTGANPVPVLLDYIGLYNTAFDLGNAEEQIKFLPQNMPVDGVIDGRIPLVFITGDAAIGNDAGLVVNSGSLSDFTRTGDIAAYSAPVYQERLTRFDQTTDILTRAAPLQLGGAEVTNSPYGLLFFSLDLTGLPLNRAERFFGTDNSFYVIIHQEGTFSLRMADVDGNRIINHRTTNAFNLTRINGFIAIDNINGSRLYIESLDAMGLPTIENVVELAGGSPFKFDYNSFTIGSDDLAFDFARLALWRLDQAPPDITDAAVRAQFYNDVSKVTVDPQLSINLLGTPTLDIYGSADEINQGLDQSGNDNNFIIEGAVTDV